MRVKVMNRSLGGALPQYETKGSAGMDLRANLVDMQGFVDLKEIIGGGRALIPTGLFVEIPEGYELQIRSRSGLSLKYGLIVLNAPGTIDSDYRGEIGVILFNAGKKPYIVRHRDKIAQAVLKKVERVEWETVERLSETARGEGGYGSTGK